MTKKNFFETTKKSEAKKKLKEMIKTHIIYDVGKSDDKYFIAWISQEDFYKYSVESQEDMDGYLKYLFKMFDK